MAQQIPNALGPLAAPGILPIGVSAGSEPNYSPQYLSSRALCMLAALLVLLRVPTVR